MTTFTITSAAKKKTLTTDHGEMQVIALGLMEYGGELLTAEWFTKATTPLPEPDSKIEGTVEDSQYGRKFKKAQVGGFTAGRGRSPEETRSIVRQHSQMVALQYATIRQQQGKLQPEDFTFENLAKIITWFDKDALEGWKP